MYDIGDRESFNHIPEWLQEVDRCSRRSCGVNQLAYLQKATGLRYAAWTTVWDVRWVPHPGLAPAKQIGNVWSGNCILSRWPISRARHVRLPQPQAQVTSGWYNWLPVRDIYNRFFAAAPAGQDYFKQSNTYLHFIADRVMHMTLELSVDF